MDVFILIVIVATAFTSTSTAIAASLASEGPNSPRPSVENAPLFARWLINEGSWGTLGTLGSDPFLYIVSYSDAATGVPYFFLSVLDPVGAVASGSSDPRACFALSERAIDDCDGADPQSPRCAKISLSGKLKKLDEESWEREMAEAALFSDHPQFTAFPKSNGTFAVYKLDIEDVFLVNKRAGRRNVTVAEYLAVRL